MSMDSIMIEPIDNIIAIETMEFCKNKPHYKAGFSSHGMCIGRQVLNILNPQPFTAQGKTEPGSAYHEFIQTKILPVGKVINNKEGKPCWAIVGHEQNVIYWDGYKLRISPIDTLAFNLETAQFEIWDWKTTGTPTKYVYNLTLQYKMQGNFYAYLFKTAWKLDYNPVVRIIYVHKVDWTELSERSFIMDENLAKNSIRHIEMVYKVSEDINKYIRCWQEIIQDALDDWKHKSKSSIRASCEYCDHRRTCLKYLGFPFTMTNEKNLLEGGVP